MWQKCPVCNGTGAIPGGHVSSSLFTTCPTCDGKRIISELTGFPPSFVSEKKEPQYDQNVILLGTKLRERIQTEELYNTYLQGLSERQSIEDSCAPASGLESNKSANKPTLGIWHPWAVCEVTTAKGHVFQVDTFLEASYGSWKHATPGAEFKIQYMGSISAPDNYALSMIHRHKSKAENESLYPWENWAVCEFVNTGGMVFHCDEEVTTKDNTWVGVHNGANARIEYIGDTDVPNDPTQTLIYRYK